MGDDPIPKNGTHHRNHDSTAVEPIPDQKEVLLEMSNVENDLRNSMEDIKGMEVHDLRPVNANPDTITDQKVVDLDIYNDRDLADDDIVSVKEELIRDLPGESIDDLSDRIANDFNDMLTAILGNIRIARSKWFNGEDIVSTLDHAEESVYRAKDLTGKLISLTRTESSGDGITHIGEVMRQMVPLILERSDIIYDLDIPDDLWFVMEEGTDFRKALLNVLMTISADDQLFYTITITARNHLTENGGESGLENGRYVRISVQDREGSKDDHDPKSIHTPVISKESKRRGLDFPAAQSFVEKQGGRIFVESQRDERIGIHIYLPALDTTDPVSSLWKRTETSSGRVLIMEHEENILENTGELLTLRGYDVVKARNGEEGISQFHASVESGEPINLIIVDLMESEGIDGLDMMRQIMKIDPDITAIVSSGYPSDPDHAEYNKLGFKGHIVKPYVIDDLIKLIEGLNLIG